MSTRAERAAHRYTVADRWMTRFLNSARGAFDGVCLGLLDRDALAAIDANYYHAESVYQDPDYNHRGFWPWEEAAVRAYFPAGGRVVVTGAGGGREVLALLAAGFDAEGFEPNPELTAVGARLTDEAGYGPRVQLSPRDEWPDVQGVVDGVIAGWSSYMLIPSQALRLAYLRGVRRSIATGGPVLLSFFPRKGASLQHRVTARVGSVVRSARRRERLELGDSLEPNFIHYFSREQVGAELSTAGFDLEDYGTDGYGWAVGRAR